MVDHETYIENISNEISDTVNEMRCQPIIFAGTGLSIRYFGAPNWKGLLDEMYSRCPNTKKPIEFYLQRDDSMPEIGSTLSERYYNWAYEESDQFPDRLRDGSRSSDIFLKHKVSNYLKSLTPDKVKELDEEDVKEEIEALRSIQPHSVITTNYDTFLESVFPEYQRIIGEEILRTPHESVGEIMKIHGCVTDPDSMVLTKENYKEFNQKKKYLSAKLLTYFSEHPILIVGYSISDRNIKNILADIDQVLSTPDGVIDNIYFLKWNSDAPNKSTKPKQKRVELDNKNKIIVNYIEAKEFDWVFNSFAEGGSIEGVNLKLLRSVVANTYDIVKEKAPQKDVSIKYDSLQRAASSEESLGTVFGVSNLEDPPDMNLFYRYNLTDVANELGYGHWKKANDLIKKINKEKGMNIKDSDNKYHVDIDANRDYETHRYSDDAVDLLERVDNNEEYNVEVSDE